MPNSILSDVWDETRAFLAREYALLLPVALMTIGLGGLVFSFAIPPVQAGQLPEGPWLLWMVPSALLVIFGTLALSELAITAGSSVGEALRQAAMALPRAIGFTAMLTLVSMLVMFVMIAVLMLFTGAPAVAAQNTISIMMVLTIIVWARLSLAFALLVEGHSAPRALTESWRLTVPVRWRLTLVLFAFIMMSGIAMLLVQFALGSVFLLIGKLTGMPVLGLRLTQVAVALGSAALQMVFVVYVARLARRLAGRP